LSVCTYVDGVPLHKSYSKQFWPILSSFSNSLVFIVALYYGQSKPSSLNEFTRDFLNEFKTLKRDGIHYQGKKISVNLKAFTCDAPARAFLKGRG